MTKTKRKHNPAWVDNTRAERSKRRREALDTIARAVGFDTWRKLETAVLNGRAAIVPEPPAGSDG